MRKTTMIRLAMLALPVAGLAAPADAQLFWHSPDYAGIPVTGDEADVVIPLPNATDAEKRANTVWTMRAGLNVAALQCEFAPSLLTRMNYNGMLTHQKKELADDYKMLGDYFKRMAPKGTSATATAAAFDQYSTRTYNSFSTLNAQIGFCQTASSIGQQALMTPKGQLWTVAQRRLREFRNSLKPAGDLIDTQPQPQFEQVAIPGYAPECFDRKGNIRKKCLAEG